MKPPEVDMSVQNMTTLDTESNHDLMTSRTEYQDDSIVEDAEEIKSE